MHYHCHGCNKVVDIIYDPVFFKEDDIYCSEQCANDKLHDEHALANMNNEGCPHDP